MPRIVAAAIHKDGVTFSIPAPARHHNIAHAMYARFGITDNANIEQGFLTSEGVFVGRRLAAELARADGQIGEVKRTSPQYELFSEDLW